MKIAQTDLLTTFTLPSLTHSEGDVIVKYNDLLHSFSLPSLPPTPPLPRPRLGLDERDSAMIRLMLSSCTSRAQDR